MEGLPMITATQLEGLRTTSDDYQRTERLKAQLAGSRAVRQPFYLTWQEFDDVLRWKLRGQYGRQFTSRLVNTDAVVRSVTSLGLTVSHEDQEYELELRMGVLCSLRGVAVPVASAVLALVYPNEYAVIDFRGWRQVFDEDRRTFSISNYRRYMGQVRRLAQELHWPVQEVDLAIWEYDRRHSE